MSNMLPMMQSAPLNPAQCYMLVFEKARRNNYSAECECGHRDCSYYEGGPCYREFLERNPECLEFLDS